MRRKKAREPRCYRLGVNGRAVPFGKQQVVFHRLPLYFHLAHPLGTDFEPLRFLVLAVFLQELHTIRPNLDAPPGAFSFGRGEHRTFARNVLQGAFNGNRTRV